MSNSTNSKVKVVADLTTGSVIVQSQNNPEYGYVRVEQVVSIIDSNQFLRRKVRSALIHGLVADLKLEKYYNGQELPGNIVVEESMEPFNQKNPEKDLKVAGSTGIVLTKDGNPIYRRTRYTSNLNETDSAPIKHDNVEELRTAYSAGQAAVKPNTSFDSI